MYTKIGKSVIATLFVLMAYVSQSYADIQPQWVIDMYEAHKYKTMAYRLLRPVGFDSSKSYPVVITLHNGPGMADSTQSSYNISNLRPMNASFAAEPLRSDYPAYILAPQTNSAWGSSELQLCKEIIANLPSVDMSRIYVMGQSMGGMGTFSFLILDPTYFAAGIAASGFARVGDASTIVNTNIWAIHGSTDTTVPYSKDSTFFEKMKTLQGRMKFTTLIGVGHSLEYRMIRTYQMSDIPVIIPVDSLRKGYITQAAGPNFDPETDTMKWLFSKSNSSNTSVNRPNKGEDFIFNKSNSTIRWSEDLVVNRVVLLDMIGKTVELYSEGLDANMIQFNCRKRGVYFVQFYQNRWLITTKKIIME